MTSSPNSAVTPTTPLPDTQAGVGVVSGLAAAATNNTDTGSDPTPTNNPPAVKPTATPPRPIHPMPTSFPELSLPIESRLPRPVMPQIPAVPEPLANPHNVFDGHGRYSPEHVVCGRCGSSNLAQGQIVDYGDKFRDLLFAPRRVSLRWLNSVLAILPFRALVKTTAIACRDCGLVQLTIDPSELRRAEHRRD